MDVKTPSSTHRAGWLLNSQNKAMEPGGSNQEQEFEEIRGCDTIGNPSLSEAEQGCEAR